MGMTQTQFGAFLDKAYADLKEKQTRLEHEYGLGDYARWWFEQALGKLQFFDANDRLALEAEVVLVGSYSPNANTWKWGWSNASFLPPLRERAGKLKDLGEITGFELFDDEETFTIEGESQAWEIAAIAVSHLDAEGCYRTQATKADGPLIFFALTKLTRVGVQ